MIVDLFTGYIQNIGPAGLLWLYLILHLTIGLLLPSRHGMPPLFKLIHNAGHDLERRLNRETRAQRSRFMRGVAVALFMGFVAWLIGAAVQRIAGMFAYGWIAQLVFLFFCINAIGALKMTRRMMDYLAKNDLQNARDALQPMIAAPLDKADAHTIVRCAIELIATALNHALVGPALWFVVAGPLGVAFYVTYAALYQAFGVRDTRRLYFGRAVRGVYLLLNLIPSMVTALLICVASLFVSKSNPLRALVTLFGQGGMPQTWPKAAIAGGLGVTLGGPLRYSDDYVDEQPWIGPEGSSAKGDAGDLMRAMMLQYVFFLCVIVVNTIYISMSK